MEAPQSAETSAHSTKTKKLKTSKMEKVDETNINEYITSKIGMEPNAWGSKRRWHFLRTMAKHIYDLKKTDFDSFFVWTSAHCQCMKLRTLREDYLDTLERLGFVRIDWNTGFIVWTGE
jgi:hypothetical protein